MKIFLILSCIILSFAILSCQKDEELKITSQEIMRANIDGKTFAAINFVMATTAQTTSINGTAGNVSKPESISIVINNLQVGTFELSETTHYAAYNSASDEFLSSSGQVIITSIKDKWIEGRFKFTAQSVNNPSLQVQISDGLFKLKLE